MPKLGAVQFLNFKKDRFDQEGKTSVEANLKGLEAGFSAVNGEPTPDSPSQPASEPLGETQTTQRLSLIHI